LSTTRRISAGTCSGEWRAPGPRRQSALRAAAVHAASVCGGGHQGRRRMQAKAVHACMCSCPCSVSERSQLQRMCTRPPSLAPGVRLSPWLPCRLQPAPPRPQAPAPSRAGLRSAAAPTTTHNMRTLARPCGGLTPAQQPAQSLPMRWVAPRHWRLRSSGSSMPMLLARLPLTCLPPRSTLAVSLCSSLSASNALSARHQVTRGTRRLRAIQASPELSAVWAGRRGCERVHAAAQPALITHPRCSPATLPRSR
jgi:hypothetical protein